MKHNFLSSVVLTALASVATADIIYTAQFQNPTTLEMLGSVKFNQGRISVEIISSVGVPQTCYGNSGYAWHLHANNNLPHVNGSYAYGFGPAECGKPQAGYHYDPTLSCSAQSDADACACLNRAQSYNCVFSTDPYSCELGDFNSKYEQGHIGFEPPNGLTNGVNNFEDHYLDIDLEGKSIVFHCGDYSTMFCGALVSSETQENNPRVAKSVSDPASIVADFGFGAVIIDDAQITSSFEKNVLDELVAHIPASCYANGFAFHIHDKWTHVASAAFGDDCGATFTGGHYDPTGACGPASGNPECGTCGLLSSNYNCQFGENPYSCEVGDLSGKYGNIDINVAYKQTDSDFLPGLHLLQGKSIVLHCADGSRAVCAKLAPGATRANKVTYTDGTEVVNNNPGTLPPLDCSKVKCAKDLDAAASTELNAVALVLVLSLGLFR